MQTETPATETTTETAQTVDTAAASTEAPASATAATATEGDTSTTTETEGDSGTQQEQDRNERGQFKSGVQKRIDDLTFRRNQAEREAAHWRAVAESRAPAAAPKLADFDSHDEYDQAMLEHRIDDGVSRGLAKTAEQQAEKFSTEAQQAAKEVYNQRVSAAVTAIPDFVDVVSKTTAKISPALEEALLDSDRGPELVYHLAKNPAEADRLNAMNDRQMNREIGRLEAAMSTAKPAPPAARTTSAPAPIKPGSPASAPANTDPNKMDQAAFEAWAKSNGSKYIR